MDPACERDDLALVLSVVNVGWLMVGLALFALSARH